MHHAYLEDKNTRSFHRTGPSDVLFRSATPEGSLVIGNTPAFEPAESNPVNAALYVHSNAVGVHSRPRWSQDIALDVFGRSVISGSLDVLRASSPVDGEDNMIVADADRLSLAFDGLGFVGSSSNVGGGDVRLDAYGALQARAGLFLDQGGERGGGLYTASDSPASLTTLTLASVSLSDATGVLQIGVIADESLARRGFDLLAQGAVIVIGSSVYAVHDRLAFAASGDSPPTLGLVSFPRRKNPSDADKFVTSVDAVLVPGASVAARPYDVRSDIRSANTSHTDNEEAFSVLASNAEALLDPLDARQLLLRFYEPDGRFGQAVGLRGSAVSLDDGAGNSLGAYRVVAVARDASGSYYALTLRGLDGGAGLVQRGVQALSDAITASKPTAEMPRLVLLSDVAEEAGVLPALELGNEIAIEQDTDSGAYFLRISDPQSVLTASLNAVRSLRGANRLFTVTVTLTADGSVAPVLLRSRGTHTDGAGTDVYVEMRQEDAQALLSAATAAGVPLNLDGPARTLPQPVVCVQAGLPLSVTGTAFVDGEDSSNDRYLRLNLAPSSTPAESRQALLAALQRKKASLQIDDALAATPTRQYALVWAADDFGSIVVRRADGLPADAGASDLGTFSAGESRWLVFAAVSPRATRDISYDASGKNSVRSRGNVVVGGGEDNAVSNAALTVLGDVSVQRALHLTDPSSGGDRISLEVEGDVLRVSDVCEMASSAAGLAPASSELKQRTGHAGSRATFLGDVAVRGMLLAPHLSSLSDARAKRGVRPLDREEAAERVRLMQVRRFNFHGDDEDEQRRHTGVVAQELREVLPDAVRLVTDYIPLEKPLHVWCDSRGLAAVPAITLAQLGTEVTEGDVFRAVSITADAKNEYATFVAKAVKAEPFDDSLVSHLHLQLQSDKSGGGGRYYCLVSRLHRDVHVVDNNEVMYTLLAAVQGLLRMTDDVAAMTNGDCGAS